MSKFYTHVAKFGNKILVRGYNEGVPFKDKVDFQPTLYVTAPEDTKHGTTYVTNQEDSKYRTLEGKPVKPVSFDSINDAVQFVEKYKDVHGFSIYGNSAWQYQYVSDRYPKEVKWDMDYVKTYTIDIETTVEHGFPDMYNPREEIILITLQDKLTKRITTFTCKNFKSDKKKLDKVICYDERDLLIKFIEFWNSKNIDVVTGWNVRFFDIPYLVARIERVLGDIDWANRLSPWNRVNEREIEIQGKKARTFELFGIATLDYLELYKKYIKTPRESYKLDNIAHVELGKKKLENPGENFKDFYTNYWDTFANYNIVDVELVDELEDKLKLIELQLTIAYMAKVNYEDIFGQVKVWETIIYNFLKQQNIVVPVHKRVGRSTGFEGAYVKDPIVGKFRNIASFDLDSLYPHLIMQYNMSPETLVNGYTEFLDIATVDKFLNKEIDTTPLKELNYSVTANGVCYDNSKDGFLPALMKSMYADRKAYKRQMLIKEQENQKNPSKELEKEIARLNNLQLALKTALNSAYGALGNVAFKYYDIRIAEGITLSGQLSIRWIANKFNIILNKICGTNGLDYVAAIDTDSNYLILEKVVEIVKSKNPNLDEIKFMDRFCDEKLQPYINASFEELADYMNAKENKMSMKRENLCDVGLFVAKKKYALNVHNSEGVQYEKPKLKVVGLELVKSSTPGVIREKLREIVSIILYKTNDDLRKYVNDFKKEFVKLPPEVVAKPSGVSDIEKYQTSSGFAKGTPINVRASILHNNLVKKHKLDLKYELIKSGDKIKYIQLKMPNPIQQNIIGFSSKLPTEFQLDNYVDYDTMFEKSFLSAVEIMTAPIKWSLEEESTLKAWF